MGKANKRTRMAGMKRFFKYASDPKDYCHYPYKEAKMNINDQAINCNIFFHPYCFSITKESIGDLEFWQDHHEKSEEYPIKQIQKMINDIDYTSAEYVDIHRILEQAKERKYTYKFKEVVDFLYLWKHKESYVKIGVLDQAFKLIDDNEKAKVYYNSFYRPIFIETSLGICCVLPVIYRQAKKGVTIIESEE